MKKSLLIVTVIAIGATFVQAQLTGTRRKDLEPASEAVHKTCFACNEPGKDGDFVFTRYIP